MTVVFAWETCSVVDKWMPTRMKRSRELENEVMDGSKGAQTGMETSFLPITTSIATNHIPVFSWLSISVSAALRFRSCSSKDC